MGGSWSVYNRNTNKWEQSWTDNQGSYFPLEGEFKDGKMVLVTPKRTTGTGAVVNFRMTFYDIKENSLMWDWERSPDDGKTWILGWRLHYTRKDKN